MKKTLLVVSTLMLSAGVSANPVFMFGTKDAYSSISALTPNKVFSKSNLSQRFCWALKDIPEKAEPVRFSLVMTSPGNSTFNFNGLNSVNKTKHEFNFLGTPVNGYFENCWYFDTSDPIGTYTLTVTADGVKYPTQAFELKK